jgi:hypothetical protein
VTDKVLVKALVGKGLTYQAVGEVLGISRQRVHQILNASVSYTSTLGKKVIYPNLLEWSIKNKCNRAEFLRKMGYPESNRNKACLYRVLTGRQAPKKDYIDKMLQVTGLTYEVMFEVNSSGD